jgi:hypothetical protein
MSQIEKKRKFLSGLILALAAFEGIVVGLLVLWIIYQVMF